MHACVYFSMPGAASSVSNEAIAYAGALLALYWLGGFAVQAWARRHPRLQLGRMCSPRLVRRDQAQSSRSLCFIGLMMALGSVASRGTRPLVESWPGAALLSFLVYDAWFYWAHRLAHTRLLYRHVHKWHHATKTPTVWSNNSDTVLDNLLMQSYFGLAFFLVPCQVVLVHKAYDMLNGLMGHCGHELADAWMARWPSPLLGVLFHDQHHELTHWNYGTHTSLWDRLCGTLHGSYDRRVGHARSPT